MTFLFFFLFFPFLLPPQLCCVISVKRHIDGKSFYAERPPQLPFSAHKKQVEKRMASVGEVGGFMEGDDR